MASSANMRIRSSLGAVLMILPLLFLQVHGHGTHTDTGSDTDSLKVKDPALLAVKVWCLVIIFAVTFLGGVSPYFLRWSESFLVVGTQFAGGIFLGTALMHFLSDSTSKFAALTPNPYPFSFMLACVGFLLTMLSDCIILSVTQKSKMVAFAKEEEEQHMSELEAGVDQAINPSFLRTTSFEDTILLVLALCFHSVFEGIAIGVAVSTDDAWKNLWTIGLHKIFAAIAMGIALLRMLPKKPLLTTALYSLAFAISSPVGVGIGIAIDETTEGSAADWTFAISMGIATGVFIYVAINHLIAKGYKPLEPNALNTPWYKFLAVLLGVAVMAVVMIWDT